MCRQRQEHLPHGKSCVVQLETEAVETTHLQLPFLQSGSKATQQPNAKMVLVAVLKHGNPNG
eukprot:1436799-Amphidinium_carterae.1